MPSLVLIACSRGVKERFLQTPNPILTFSWLIPIYRRIRPSFQQSENLPQNISSVKLCGNCLNGYGGEKFVNTILYFTLS